MKKLLSIILSIAMLFSIATVVFADGDDGPIKKAKIKVGISADFPPFEYYNENEKLYGFDVDLMNYIGERIGFDIEFVNMSFEQLFPAVMGGDVECAISAIAITEERNNVIDYTIPYLSSKVTYSDGETSDTSLEQYAIIFPNNSVEKAKVLESAGQIAIYNLVNGALIELIEDKTVEKLGEKYALNKTADTDGFDYEYTVMSVPSDLPNSENDTSGDNAKSDGTPLAPPSEWAASDVKKAEVLNITEKGEFYRYEMAITREEFCEMIYNLVVLVSPDIEYFVSDSFADTKNEKVLKLNSLGIINGKTATDFAPNDYLTREEAATIIVRMINKIIPIAATEMWFEYDDINEVSEWASDSIQTISNLGFMNGVGNNKFAPKETYTTEQAIATLVRVYAAAETSGAIKNDSSIGIIGGEDGPASIIVGGNTTEIEDEDYNNFYAEVSKNTTKVDDFYVDEAIKLISESGTLAADRDFISLYTTNYEMTNKILSLGTVDFNKPTDIFYLYADKEQMIDNIKTLAGEDAESIDFKKMEKLNKRYNFSTLAGLINASYGAENLAALTILTNSRGYIMPKDFKDDFALFVQYKGEYSAIVSFSKFGDGVISANMAFVKNGDKDNMFRRLFEITSAVGEDGIIVAKLK